MDRNVNIQKKLLLPILITLTLILSVFAFFTVTYIRQLTRIRVESQAHDLIQSKAVEIESFFIARTRVLQTFLENPFFIQWYSSYNRYRSPIHNDKDYKKIIEYINEIRIKDPTIKSIFFASEQTQEYFDFEGRYEEEGYYVKDRPWWQGAIEVRV